MINLFVQENTFRNNFKKLTKFNISFRNFEEFQLATYEKLKKEILNAFDNPENNRLDYIFQQEVNLSKFLNKNIKVNTKYILELINEGYYGENVNLGEYIQRVSQEIRINQILEKYYEELLLLLQVKSLINYREDISFIKERVEDIYQVFLRKRKKGPFNYKEEDFIEAQRRLDLFLENFKENPLTNKVIITYEAKNEEISFKLRTNDFWGFVNEIKDKCLDCES